MTIVRTGAQIQQIVEPGGRAVSYSCEAPLSPYFCHVRDDCADAEFTGKCFYSCLSTTKSRRSSGAFWVEIPSRVWKAAIGVVRRLKRKINSST